MTAKLAKESPEKLRPYLFHKLDLEYSEGDARAYADCPWCGNDAGKFSIKIETGQWRCFACNEGEETDRTERGGNVWTFIRLLWERSFQQTTVEQYQELAEDRGLLHWESLQSWGLAVSYISREWIAPGYSLDGRLNNVYVYRRRKGQKGADAKRALFGTTGQAQQMFGMGNYDPSCEIVFLTEGIWDGISLWEVLGNSGLDGNLKISAVTAYNPNEGSRESFLSNGCVLSIAGCLSFSKDYLPAFAGKTVYLLGHNDAPKDKQPLGASASGMKRITKLFNEGKPDKRPIAVRFLSYGDGPGGYNSELPDGFDLRDLLQHEGVNTLEDRIPLLAEIFENTQEVPEEWFSETAGTANDTSMSCLPCSSYKQLINAWKKAMKWFDGLDRATSAMLASILSVKILGENIWLMILGPPSSGKTTLCEALSTNKDYVLAKSTIRGFHSGWKSDADGAEDNSLVAQLRGKTLITKDGDTLLQAPNLGQILSEARDLYDSTSRTHYRNKTARDYQGIRMTWLLCGTSSLRSIDSSELGERFLHCVIMDGIDDDMEDEILARVAHRTERNMSFESDGRLDTQHDPDMALAMRLTGGYVGYLRENSKELLASTRMSDERIQQCIWLGKFVAHTRARPSKQQEEVSEREFAARLVAVLTRLAKCTAVVLNRSYVDDEVMRRVKQIALDTGRGVVLEIIEYLYDESRREEGSSGRALSLRLGRTQESANKLLRFLKQIGVVREIELGERLGYRVVQRRWILTKKMRKLYSLISNI